MRIFPRAPRTIRLAIQQRLIILLIVLTLLVPAAAFVFSPQGLMQSGSRENSYDQILAPDAGWTATGNLITARTLHTATLLANGKVLVAGGETPSGSGTVLTATCEIYDPATGIWASTGNLITARSRHTATLLANGKVVVIGGSSGSAATRSVEIYDPTSGSWASAGTLWLGRQGHTVSLLPNGKLLAAGGIFGGTAVAELYDPATATSEISGSFVITARVNHSAITLQNGKVIVAGGDGIGGPFNTAEIYDLPTGNWNLTGNMVRARNLHATSLLPNGKVLASGDTFSSPNSSELYDPAADLWTLTGNLISGRSEHTSTLLNNGLVLVAGGRDANTGQLPPGSELYTAALGTWGSAGNLNTPRYQHTATLLPNGKVLITGGRNSATVLTGSEIYDVTPTPTPTPTPTATPTPTPQCAPIPVVTNLADSGPGSLRQAIENACPGSTITFSTSVTGTIALVSDGLAITKNLTIQGPGSNLLTVSGSNFFRVFNISGPIAVNLKRLTISDGRVNAGGGSGIVNFDRSNLIVDDCVITGNRSQIGGAIYNISATITLLNSTVTNNLATNGGGIYNVGTTNIINSTISGNSSERGGGIYTFATSSTVNVLNSTISSNVVSNNLSLDAAGGGIYIGTGVLNLVNSTITGNMASGSSTRNSYGGGVYNETGINGSGTISVKSTIIANNSLSGGILRVGPDVSGVFNSQGYNLIGKNEGSANFPSGTPNLNLDIVGTTAVPVNPLLGPLASNGGPTQTHALLAGSPAIDKGSPATNPATGSALTTDQRGFTRPVNDPSIPPAGTAGNNSDIGAFEVQTTPVTTTYEGDVVDGSGGPGGDGLILSNDVSVIRQFALGLATPVTTTNQFQRADINGVCGDGAINSADVTVVRLILLGSITPTFACGPTAP